MLKFVHIIPLLLFLVFLSFSPDKKDDRYKIVKTYKSPEDHSKNYYVSIAPSDTIKGVIVYLPGFGQLPEECLEEINIEILAAKNDLLFIALTHLGRKTHYLCDSSLIFIDDVIKKSSAKYNLADQNFIIGGFSIGGTGAFRYAELYKEGNSKHNLNLAGIFGVDPPLDLERLWKTEKKHLSMNLFPISVNEANFMIDLFNKILLGSPETNYYMYRQKSPFLASDSEGGRAKLLQDLPIRIYSEPDTLWWRNNRGVGYDDINYIDQIKFINLVNSNGSDSGKLIITKNKGYRRNGVRHPHSWSIVDENDLINWCMKNLNHNK